MNMEVDVSAATAGSNDQVVIGTKAYKRDSALEVIGVKLESLTQDVGEVKQLPLGVYRGLRFGMVLHPRFPPDIYCEGMTRHRYQLARNAGPRALLNALDRLVEDLPNETQRTKQDLQVAETQLHDYQMRIGSLFAHDTYLKELAQLRDQLRLALSNKASDQSKEPEEDPSAISARIKALKEKQAPAVGTERIVRRGSSSAEPVTHRIRERKEERMREHTEVPKR
jgi:hypothetical protein